MIKKIIRDVIGKFGFELRRVSLLTDVLIEENNDSPLVDSSIVDNIFDFFNIVQPFYTEDVRPELKIAGAWRADFKNRRKNQLNFINTGDKAAYSNLLTNMLRNELLSGVWAIGYYEKKNIGTKAPLEFLHNLEQFTNLTSHNIDILDDGAFGSKWGVKVDGTLLNYVDPYKGVNAFNIANVINFICDKRGTYIDLGSGIGSDAIKVEKFSETPLRSILIDLPLNLTSAFAYVSMNTGKKCVLFSNEDELIKHLQTNFSESEFLFVPTTLIKTIGESGLSIDLMYNHGSLSEMDFNTVEFYFKNLLNGTVKSFFEINSNKEVDIKGHTEVKSSKFPIPSSYKLLKSNPSINNYFNHRYIENLYIFKP
jgi:hypothetical protein